MKVFKNYLKQALCLVISIVLVAMFFVSLNFNNASATTSANEIDLQNNQTTTQNFGSLETQSSLLSHSNFIYSPTYSIFYHQSIYFFDEYDNLLKIYKNNKLDDSSLDVSTLGNIIDVTYYGEYIFVLSKTSSDLEEKLCLSIIDITEFEITKTITLDSLNTGYSGISICEYENDWLISLSPANTEESSIAPAILTLNQTSNEITNTCLLQIESNILKDLFDVCVIKSAGTNENDVYMVLTFGKNIYFFGTTKTKIKSESNISIDTSKNSLYETLESSSSNISLADVNTITVNGKLLFLITYTELVNSENNTYGTYSKLYSYKVDAIDEQKNFESVLKIPTQSENYIMTSNSYVLYPVQNAQTIIYTEIFYNDSEEIYSDNTFAGIKNPTLDIQYKNESSFEYVYANKQTLLLSNPWSYYGNDNYIIENARDLIVIGNAKILGQNSTIEDYKYCLLTIANKNLKGYVKTEDLTAKSNFTYNFEYCQVQPNTKLYSLPTTVVGSGIDKITDTLNATIISNIPENSTIKIIDSIYKYMANEKIMVKVEVNGNQIGYVEYDKIIKPGSLDFVITNASIKSDDTEIYLSADSSSAIIWTLNKGYRIRINGSRNTETGYTSITFNDEYGNEKTGYVLTDKISSDSWTTMQIIGCVLIAINIGLLILILRFKMKNIGNDGSKYIEKER